MDGRQVLLRTIEQLEKKARATQLAVHQEARAIKTELRVEARNEHKEQRDIPIARLVAEHSHNNHHGLPGANKYAHKGPTSKPRGKNKGRSARKKKR